MAGRPDWGTLLDDVGGGQLDIVAFWTSSRGSRTMTEWSQFLDLVRLCGVKVWIHTHERLYDIRRPRDWKMLAEDGVSNAYYSDELSQAVRRALAANASQGKHHGPPPYGYRLVFSEDGVSSWQPDSEQAAAVAEMFKRIAAQHPLRALSRDLGLSRRAIQHMARNRVYLGLRGDVEGDWPPLVERETFNAVQNVLNEPGRKVTRGNQPKFLLSYIAYCPCGERLGVLHRKLTRAWAATSGRWSDGGIPAQVFMPHYLCPTGRSGHTGRVPVMWADLICELEIGRVFAQPENWAFLNEPDNAELTRLDTAIDSARTELAAMEADAKASGSAVMARIAMAQEATVNRLEADRAALTRPARPKVLLDAPLRWEDTAQRIEAVVRAWRRFPLEVQRASLRSSCRPVLNPPDGLLEDPRRWEWNWGQSGS